MANADYYAKLGAKAKFLQNVEENRRLAAAYPGLDQEVKQEIASQRMATARAAKTVPGKRRGRKPGSKNKTTLNLENVTQTHERRNAVDEISGIKE